jgi:hypothetical protein
MTGMECVHTIQVSNSHLTIVRAKFQSFNVGHLRECSVDDFSSIPTADSLEGRVQDGWGSGKPGRRHCMDLLWPARMGRWLHHWHARPKRSNDETSCCLSPVL